MSEENVEIIRAFMRSATGVSSMAWPKSFQPDIELVRAGLVALVL
jgi:hypothetical protein